jgi:pimeloyl-ACP methyl ester carboxylesterase
MKDGFARTAHGRIHYLEAGSGAPLVLLHSNGASAWQYEHVIGAKGNALSNRPIYEESLGRERVAVLPECGHFPMIDDPALFVREVERLLAIAAKQPAAA